MAKKQTMPLSSQPTAKKFWNFAAPADGAKEAELRIDGEIIDDGDAWIYEWFGIPVASPNAFRTELSNYENQDIVVWINSPGGSVFAAAGIYNALMEHKKSGAGVTVKIDGWAASAATVIAMAGDKILISPLAMMMVHEPLMPGVITGVGYADDHVKTAEVLNQIKETIINAYESKTGKSRDELAGLLKEEHYMNAQAAVDEGFADGMLYTDKEPEKITNISFNHSAVLNAATLPLDKIREIAQKAAKNQPVTPEKPDDKINNKKGDSQEMEIKSAQDLKTQLPAVYDEVYNAGSAAERERLKAFDVISDRIDPEFLASEKYKDGATAEGVLFNAVKEGKTVNSAYVKDAEKDAETVNKVPGDTSDDLKPNEVSGVLNRAKAMAEKALGIKGGKQ